MIVVLVAFAVAAYLMSGSVLTAVIQTIICAVLIQAGYFVCILYAVRREKLEAERNRPDIAAARASASAGAKRDEVRADAPHNLPARDI
jgi:exopolysaccharide production repressor protein